MTAKQLSNSLFINTIKNDILQDGFSIIRHFLTDKYIDGLIEQLDRYGVLSYDSQKVTDFNLLRSFPFINMLAVSRQLMSVVEQLLGETSFPVNAFILDKTQDNNWSLNWHQDLKIAVKCKIETTGYSNWTVESGIPHTIPPQDILEKRISVRIHLDDCHIDNGAMLVVPQSHKKGILYNKSAIAETASEKTVYCEVEKGGIMIFTPLLLHKSPYSTTNRKRRVLQIDYAGTKLENGLEWNN